MQWLAVNLPHAMDSIHELAEDIIRQHRHPDKIPRASPAPALTFELSGQLEYIAATVNDEYALVVPASDLLGRYVGDVVPSNMAERFLKSVRHARTRRRPATMRCTVNGRTQIARIIAPAPDRVITTVSVAP